jgi:hypothetical protein
MEEIMIYRLSIDTKNTKGIELINMLDKLSADSDYLEFEQIIDENKISNEVRLMLEQRSKEAAESPETLMYWEEYEKVLDAM